MTKAVKPLIKIIWFNFRGFNNKCTFGIAKKIKKMCRKLDQLGVNKVEGKTYEEEWDTTNN